MGHKIAKKIRQYLRARGVDPTDNKPSPTRWHAMGTRRNAGGRRVYRDFKKGMRHV